MLNLLYVIGSFVLCLHQSESSYTNFEVKCLELCNNTQGSVKFYGNITTDSNNNQYLSFNILSPFDFDENIGVVCDIYSKTFGTHFVELFTIREKNFCKAANMYMEEFWYDLERSAQITPGICPIRGGKYNGHHVYLDFQKMSLLLKFFSAITLKS